MMGMEARPYKQETERMSKEFAEGRKDDEGKSRWDLVPRSFQEVINVYTMGARKYADRNWEKGIKWSRIFGAMMRHSWNWWWGETHDPVDGQHHLASAAWCALALMEYEETHPELDDRPYSEPRRKPKPITIEPPMRPIDVGFDHP